MFRNMASVPNLNDRLDMRKPNLQGCNLLEGYFTVVDAPVCFFGLFKKGESFLALNWASLWMVF